MLVRAWNLHLGKDASNGRRDHTREMVELITADRPLIVCLQEVPSSALDKLGDWAGMQAVGVRAQRSKLGPLGGPGKGNAILFPKEAKLRQEKQITLNTNPFCEEQAGKLGYSLKEARWWEKERRVCQVVKIEFPDRKRWLIANLHATSLETDRRLADLELGRAVKFIDRQAETEETVIVGGDFNIPLAESGVLGELAARIDEGYAPVTQGAVQILVRGRVMMSGLRIWPEAERMLDGVVLSDHAPVEVDVAYRVRRAAPEPQEERAKLPTLAEAQRAAPLTPPEPSPPGEPEPQSTEDDRWETPGGERWDTPGDQRWETDR
jgi:endonuclease/exonuclease/phosphatase family metal-dependent hydrolase